MNAFGYYDPTSVQKAVGIAAHKRDAHYLAGGQSLIAMMKLGLAEPSDLIDLAQIPDLRGVRVEGNGLAITIGAMTRHAEVAESLEVGARIPALASLASVIGDRQVQNRGTLGGKGCGEAGAIGAPAAVINAICDAVDVKDVEMPATSERVWRAIQSRRSA